MSTITIPRISVKRRPGGTYTWYHDGLDAADVAFERNLMEGAVALILPVEEVTDDDVIDHGLCAVVKTAVSPHEALTIEPATPRALLDDPYGSEPVVWLRDPKHPNDGFLYGWACTCGWGTLGTHDPSGSLAQHIAGGHDVPRPHRTVLSVAGSVLWPYLRGDGSLAWAVEHEHGGTKCYTTYEEAYSAKIGGAQ